MFANPITCCPTCGWFIYPHDRLIIPGDDEAYLCSHCENIYRPTPQLCTTTDRSTTITIVYPNETPIIINKESLDSCMSFSCTCGKCQAEFVLSCQDARRSRFCPMCGVPFGRREEK